MEIESCDHDIDHESDFSFPSNAGRSQKPKLMRKVIIIYGGTAQIIRSSHAWRYRRIPFDSGYIFFFVLSERGFERVWKEQKRALDDACQHRSHATPLLPLPLMPLLPRRLLLLLLRAYTKYALRYG
ncbi:hypothetical protein TWF225_010513 [Orbilia oligospora]|uniref:Uncharacterized protein n=1 Tax=Orbilia oligospora TaxID=2813651 RepID=A0A7C8KIE0_ORBOL|nr:hypothetical protein TWF751_009716 [Orbilia oligospora]KAF3171654.1 hypothetical protein TWF225_010513 [Orbilia oligospora]KAF3242893.1 hypothetical protein TWF128_010360 [Orbilia oligospora]KAF3260340.1 hypothetical protein TWF217_004913 [Orbilia oligospora]KAF3278142.1 hypothetical protein TWF132_001253 [Orbilia oligospora]